METHIYIEDKIVMLNKNNTFNINDNNTLFFENPKNYIKYWNIEGIYVLIQCQKGYYLVSKYISFFTYEYNIVDTFSTESGKLSILTDKGILRIIQDKHKNFLMIEIMNFFELKTNEKISSLMSKCEFRYIPFIITL